MGDENKIYYNEFFDGRDYPDQYGLKPSFTEHPIMSNLSKRDMLGTSDAKLSWEDRSKFYFLPFLTNCYKFTRQHRLPYFALMVSPTMMFYRDRLHLRNYLDSIHRVFFKALDMCGVLHEPIMLLVEKRFSISNPIDGGSQQLYNMLWDIDLKPEPTSCIIPNKSKSRTSYNPPMIEQLYDPNWKDYRNKYFNPDIPDGKIELTRGTLWLQDDLNFLCKKYTLSDEYKSPFPPPCGLYQNDWSREGEWVATEMLDYANLSDTDIRKFISGLSMEGYEKLRNKCQEFLDSRGFRPDGDIIVQVWKYIGNDEFMRMIQDVEPQKLPGARDFYFKVFKPKDVEPDEDDEIISSDSDLDDIDDFDPIDGNGMIDSTISLEQEDEEMKKILAFFANMPKVTNLVQGMLDMITGLTRILPLVADKLDKPEDSKLKDALIRVIGILNLGTDKILKICRFLGIKIEKKESGAICVIVKNRFKKGCKKEFIEYEIDQLNKVIDGLENADENDKLNTPIHPCDIPPDLTPNNLYPQRMPLHRPHIHLADNHSLEPHFAPPCDNHHHHDPVHDFLAEHDHKHDCHQPPPPPNDDGTDNKVEIPSVIPEPPNDKPDEVNGIQ